MSPEKRVHGHTTPVAVGRVCALLLLAKEIAQPSSPW